ncbi:pyrroline-5-carboxylate reductase [Marinomonas ostreistagni]|uniref:Pyrroline-5-carboxylate reductase n=1 Tax=Marinomonas ostreistagni TaxID=359209 RepID=A0ABS0Z9S4_9GAMM|nr:pyrroline-5-carboxylate reductase [Marinomonas ostreistagni]MBJ7550405.1 pyrroline-5-carboxylate reductase [Marinomonas ostreistagni]
MSLKIAFIGVGNMASAIIGGLRASGYAGNAIVGSSINIDDHPRLEQRFGMTMHTDNKVAVAEADVIFLCVKPNLLQTVVEEFAPVVRPDQLFVSVAAGVEISSLEAWLKQPVAVVRSMPNTPALVGSGMSGLIANTHTTDAQKTWVSQAFDSFGSHVWIDDEAQMHTVTALSGSAPAYFFRILEVMIEAGIAQGLDEATSRKLATYAMKGAAAMVTELDEDIDQLRRNITSPNGTTQAALETLEDKGVHSLMTAAVDACAARSKELGKEFANK